MSSDSFPSFWTGPNYVATVVGVLALGVLIFYTGLSNSGLTVDEVLLVTLVLMLPASVAHEVARRWL